MTFISVVTDNSNPVVTLGLASDFLGLSPTEDLTLLEELQAAAIEVGEGYTGRQFFEREYQVQFGFRDICLSGVDKWRFELELAPMQGVISLSASVILANGNVSTRNITTFELLEGWGYPTIVINDALLDVNEDVDRPFTMLVNAGYTSDQIPTAVKLALKQHVAFLHANRGDFASESMDALPEVVKRNYGNIKILRSAFSA